ncbi:MAG: hypothetical protein K8R67_05420 [Desulfobacteraceae bacterium]|nr:hypothetical protein [Desulfobacteraceae bacterium]
MEQSNKPNNKPNNKPTDKSGIYWILQDNQITPFITDFLELLQHRVNSFTKINFLIPSHNSDTLKAAKKLNPIPFKMSSKIKPNSLGGFKLKKSLIGDHEFSDGLSFWRTLLLDDLGSGNLFRAQIHHEIESDTQAIILQIPTPLGSSASEERVFYAWVYLAKQAGIPVLGYELLPLDTRWTLAPSLLDGVITTSYDSYRHLTENKTDMKKKIWLAPRYEGRFFSPGCPPFWRNGLGAAYQYQKESKIDFDKTIIYLPHNVAMTYEYKDLVSHLTSFSDQIHLMFCIGKDQIRGTHKHNEIIEIISKKNLKEVSYSFHDLNMPWEMTIADCVVACSSCYATSIAINNNIPTIIYDPMVRPHKKNAKQSFNNISGLLNSINEVISSHKERDEFAKIFFQITDRTYLK